MMRIACPLFLTRRCGPCPFSLKPPLLLPETSQQPSTFCAGGLRKGSPIRFFSGSPARARPSPWPRSLLKPAGRPWSWPPTRPWPPNSMPSSRSCFPQTRWSISSATTTITSPRRTSPRRIPISRRTPPSTRPSTRCATPPLGRSLPDGT